MSQKRKMFLNKHFSEKHLEQLRQAAPEVDFLYEDLHNLPDETLKELDAVLGWSGDFGKRFEALDQARLSWVQTVSAGVDSLNQAWMAERGISLTTSSGVHGYPIRESVFGMLLGLGRGVVHAVKHQVEGEWNSNFKPALLQGKTMMIFGTGAIGESIAELAVRGFDMKTIGVNRSGRQVPYMDEIVQIDAVKDRLADADVIVAILPLTEDSRAYFNRDFFARMKQDSVFVNMGRGPSVVTEDLIEALNEGRPAFAALDVTDPEPLPAGHALWSVPNVLITPHISGGRPDYNDRVIDIILENIAAIQDGGKPVRNVVDFKRGY